MSDLYDRIAASAPLNKTAGVVTSRSEESESGFKPCRPFWHAPPLVKRPTCSSPEFVDLTGRVVGRLRVMGLLGEKKDSRGTISWVVRCVCGIYETRKSRSIKTGNPDEMCQFCAHTSRLKIAGSKPRTVESFLAENCGVPA